MNTKTFTLLLFLLTLAACSPMKESTKKSSVERINMDLQRITKSIHNRNCANTESLNQTAEYIFTEMKKVSDTVYYQNFIVNGLKYKNVISSIGVNKKERLIIGAHYDVAGEQEGADDNASGVAGLLELARLLSKEKLDFRIDFVAYTLEEPPYFGSNNMGSYIHAKYLKENNVDVKGMICLEMIGYYNDSPGSQQFPLGILKWFYGNKGNFITVVQSFSSGRFGKKVEELMTKQNLIPTKSFKGPKNLAGIDFSDHRNYWKFGYDAVMITNTSFYRNHNYHEITDTIETLDLKKMSQVIDEVCNCVLNL